MDEGWQHSEELDTIRAAGRGAALSPLAVPGEVAAM